MTLPGMRERTRAHRLRRQDVLADRLEGRLRHRRGRAPRPSPRRISSSRSRPRPTSSRRSPSASAKEDGYIASSQAPAGKRDQLGGGLARLGFGVVPTRAPTSSPTDFRPLGLQRRRCRHMPAHDGGGRRDGDPGHRVLRCAGSAASLRICLLLDRRRAGRGGGSAREAFWDRRRGGYP